MKAWHFLSNDRRLGYGDGREVKIGETLSCTGKPESCVNGMHGSKRIIDALQYAPGTICCRVEITGDVIIGNDKIVGRHRKVLWMVDVEETLHEFACRCAEGVLHIIDNDPIAVAAIKAKRDWICGTITDAELASAWASARASARASAWDSAWDSAGASAWASARASAWASAWDSAWDKQNRRLTSIVIAKQKEANNEQD